MNSESPIRPVGRRPRSESLVVVIAAAIALLSFGVVTVAQDPDRTSANDAGRFATTKIATASNSAVEGMAVPAKEQVTAEDAQRDPRECDLTKGISSACIFE